ncbi:MAG: two-component system sensor histidine kinase CbrA [Gammaproteobacteria bacterium]
MIFDLGHLYFAAVAYLAILFLIAYAVDQNWIPRSVARHPITYVLSLGVYATSWSYYGSVGFAESQGYNFLTIYLGVTLAFVVTPFLLQPILRLTREYQLSSLADLFSFRFRSQFAGVLVTLFMLAGTLPYIALQIRAVTESLRILTQQAASADLALGFCITLTAFAILFGARHISPRDKHEGLVVAIAFESLVKLLALMMVGLFALFGVFGGFSGLDQWLLEHPEALQKLYEPVKEGPWSTFILLSFAAAFLLPRQFHMTFAENIDERTLPIASWGFPLYLLLLNLAIPVVLWAGIELAAPTEPDYYVLGITLQSGNALLPTFAFLGGVSAASAMMIVTTLALAAMCLNHLLLPASYPDPKLDIYRWLLWGRRALIAVIIFTGYFFAQLLEKHQGLAQLGLISFVAVAQFLPGVVGLLYWPRATRWGFIAGLLGGGTVWAATLLIPLLQDAGFLVSQLDPVPLMQTTGQDKWTFATFWSLVVNGVLFVGFSILSRPSREEQDAANACCRHILMPMSGALTAFSPDQYREQLSRYMGESAADKEVSQALRDLGMGNNERRPAELRRLRDQIERNLSGLVGPQMARMFVENPLKMSNRARIALADGMRFIEERVEESRIELQGLAAELDALRRYHRQILQDLPLGVCSLGPNQEIVVWNLAMELLSGIERNEVLATPIQELPDPWGKLFAEFIGTKDRHLHKQKITVDGRVRWLNLHKAAIENPGLRREPGTQADSRSGMVLLVEDLTDLQLLEDELVHSERLASIGRLAAGVAHEIGNPVTGIACLAQNLRDEIDSEEMKESVNQILAQTQRIGDIVHSLVSFSHGGMPDGSASTRLNLCACIEEALRLVRLSHAGKQVECLNHCDREIEITGDRQRLIQVFVNLLTNACDASEPGSQVEVESRLETDRVRIDVIDHGCGIPEPLHEQIFEPFFTTKEPGKGTGLGLPLVYSIVQDHGGSIQIESEPGKGTRFVVRLPLDETLTPARESGTESSGAVAQ